MADNALASRLKDFEMPKLVGGCSLYSDLALNDLTDPRELQLNAHDE